ncbi:MAG: tyrosine-type recombinase/integrase [Clostridiales bacterium]|nr:tyrosine-type recombinase/integrase [Clostridiales bacterium]
MKAKVNKVNEFIAFCKVTKNLSDKTICAYKQDLAAYVRYVNETGDANVMRYVSNLIDTNHKTTTIKRHIATLGQYFKYVYRNDKISNPMLQFEFKLKSEKTLPRTISVREVKRLLATLYKLRDEATTKFATFQITRDLALIDLLCSTGIRIGEAAAITVDDVDLRSKIILIHGKGKKERLIYLSCAETVTNLKRWLVLRSELAPSHSFVFVNRELSPISIHGIENIFDKYRNLAQINVHATPHYLRHTFATNLLANGSDLRSVQEILGHSNVSITERYTEVTTSRKIKVLKKFNYRNNLLENV